MKYSALGCIALCSLAIAASGCSKKGAEGGSPAASEPVPNLERDAPPLPDPVGAQPDAQVPGPPKGKTGKTQEEYNGDPATEGGPPVGSGNESDDDDDDDDDDKIIEEEVPAE